MTALGSAPPPIREFSEHHRKIVKSETFNPLTTPTGLMRNDPRITLTPSTETSEPHDMVCRKNTDTHLGSNHAR